MHGDDNCDRTQIQMLTDLRDQLSTLQSYFNMLCIIVEQIAKSEEDAAVIKMLQKLRQLSQYRH